MTLYSSVGWFSPVPGESSNAQRNPFTGKIAVAYTFPQKDTFGIYFRKGDPLGAKLRAGVAKLKRNGTLVRLARKYKIPVSDVR